MGSITFNMIVSVRSPIDFLPDRRLKNAPVPPAGENCPRECLHLAIESII
ncbi:MAG: hypothetical protein WBA89_25570 [Microcoleus sp.]